MQVCFNLLEAHVCYGLRAGDQDTLSRAFRDWKIFSCDKEVMLAVVAQNHMAFCDASAELQADIFVGYAHLKGEIRFVYAYVCDR